MILNKHFTDLTIEQRIEAFQSAVTKYYPDFNLYLRICRKSPNSAYESDRTKVMSNKEWLEYHAAIAKNLSFFVNNTCTWTEVERKLGLQSGEISRKIYNFAYNSDKKRSYHLTYKIDLSQVFRI